jgi:8-oxo-dGTP diphosphatase
MLRGNEFRPQTHVAGSRSEVFPFGIWDGRIDRVHFFELRLEQLPELRLDNREIIGARLVPAAELRGMALTGPVTAYLGRTPPPGCHP